MASIEMNEAQDEMAVERSVRVKLRASPDLLKRLGVDEIEDSPSIAIPSSIQKQGLTTVVNQFLTEVGLENLGATAYEFMDIARETLLRTTLEKHMKKYKLTEEDLLILEYDIPRYSNFSAEGPGVPVPDWISCLSVLGDVVVAGTFDGSLITNRFSNDGLQGKSTEREAHPTQITAASLFRLKGLKDIFVASASKDASVAIRPINPDDSFGNVVSTCVSEQAKSIESIVTAQSSDDADDVLLANGGWSGDIDFFQASCINKDDSKKSKAKAEKDAKRSRAQNDGTLVAPSFTLRGHTDKVSALKFSSDVDPVTLYSGSWDHSLRIWDCVRQVETAALHAQKPFNSIDFLETKQILASAHPDHVVRLWDSRTSGDAIVKFTLKGHRGWVSSVAFQGADSTLLASASYDRTVRVWDIRGGAPVQTIQTEVTGRLFSVAWAKGGRLLVGGTDANIRTYMADQV